MLSAFAASSVSACTPAPQPPAPPARIPAAPVADESFGAMEAAIVTSVNRRRREAGLTTLTVELRLTRAARLHAGNMAARRELSHTISGTTTSTLLSRIADVEYRFSSIAENIAYGAISAEEVTRGWMGSPGHRTNIMNPAYTETGVGIARASNGDLYYCQVFGRPRLAL